MNEFEYTKKQGVDLLNKLLIPKGYTMVSEEEDNLGPYWYKEHEAIEDSIWFIARISLDLTATISPEKLFDHDSIFVKSYWWELERESSGVDDFVIALKEAEKELSDDLDEVHKAFEEAFAEKKSDDVYTLTTVYDDYGRFDEDGLPGVSTQHEEEYDSLDEALKDFYASISFNDEEVTLYRGNKDITDEIIKDEELFKKFYADEEAKSFSDFKHLTYEQAWQCVKEYAEEGYSESIQQYIDAGTIK